LLRGVSVVRKEKRSLPFLVVWGLCCLACVHKMEADVNFFGVRRLVAAFFLRRLRFATARFRLGIGASFLVVWGVCCLACVHKMEADVNFFGVRRLVAAFFLRRLRFATARLRLGIGASFLVVWGVCCLACVHKMEADVNVDTGPNGRKEAKVRRVQFDDQPFVAAGHENPADPGVWKKVLFKKDELQVGRIQMVNWAKLPVGRTFAAHYHEDMQEMFIVVSGEARIRVDGVESELRRGDTILIDAREVHEMWNGGAEDVEYLAIGIAGGADGRTIVVDGQ